MPLSAKKSALFYLWLLFGWSWVCGCDLIKGQPSKAQPTEFSALIIARTDGRTPLAGVEVLAGKKVVGKTDESGKAKLSLQGSEGSVASLTIKCPEGLASPEVPIEVGLRHMAEGSPPPLFETECVSLVRRVVVGLRAENGPGLPIVRLNEVIGKTNDQGIAHLLLEVSPNEQVTLTLDTKGNSRLLPQNPALTFVASGKDEFVLLEQKFNVKKKKVKPKPKPAMPTRL